jgi:Ca-activated chloride channel family protein
MRAQSTSNASRVIFAFFAIPALAISVICGCKSNPYGVTKLPREAAFGYQNYGPAPSLTDNALTLATQTPPTDELWVIARGDSTGSPAAADQPGSGTLLTTVRNQDVPMPLKHTDVHASISGFIGTVEVSQQFQNPYSSKIEARYVFPLPHDAAVNEFIMTIGDRRIRGIIRERKEAEQIYEDAKRQGYVASLLTEERPNIFTQSVANIEPGKEIDVNIKYIHTLEYTDGWYEFTFPMVVGPRFNPAGMTNGIGEVPRGKSGQSGQSTEVHYLAPGERNGHNIGLHLDIDAGVPIEEFRCKTHDVTSQQPSPERLSISLNQNDSVPNRDFVLRYRVAGDQIKSGLITSRDERGQYFALMLYPPKAVETVHRQPMEIVFVIDCSGSMDGRPIRQAKAAVARGLRLLQSGDSFQLINFSMSASQLGSGPLEANPDNIHRAFQYLQRLNAEGGTMMIEGVKAALDFPHDPNRLRVVCFLTDGYIGNEPEILAEVHKRLGPTRIFSFGIGSAVNHYLIDNMAKTGHGAVAYLGLRDEAPEIMENFFDRISHPALTSLSIDWGSVQADEVFPRQLPDVFVGRPITIVGRFSSGDPSTIRFNGIANGERTEIPRANSSTSEATHSGLPSIWARMKIADLAEQSIRTPDREWAPQIKQVALDYQLMSAFTAFIAVDSTRQTEGAEGTTVPVAVPVPEGVKYKTTVPQK